MITSEMPFNARDDQYHALSTDPYETETNWWSFNIPERKIGCWLHAPYYPNRNTLTWRVFVWDDRAWDIGHLAYYRKVEEVAMPTDPDLRDITFPGGGYRLQMLEPLMKYALSYADDERKFALEFTHTGTHLPRRFTPGEPPFMQTPHLDQLGHVEGVLTLDGERIPIDSYSVRDRTWGPRGGPYATSRIAHGADTSRVLNPGGPRWREIERERGRGRIEYIFGHCGPDTGFLGFVRTQEGDANGWSPMNAGWLLRDGVFGHLDKTKSRMLNFRDPLTGWSDHMQVMLGDDRGRTMEVEGLAVSRMSETGYAVNSLMHWEFDGKVGWGEDQDVFLPDHFQRLLGALKATK
jgi:hypothetical protein